MLAVCSAGRQTHDSRASPCRRPSAGTARRPDGIFCLFEPLELGNNVGTMTPKHREKRGSRADQKAGRINKIAVPALSAKPPSPVQIRAAPPKSLGPFRAHG